MKTFAWLLAVAVAGAGYYEHRQKPEPPRPMTLEQQIRSTYEPPWPDARESALHAPDVRRHRGLPDLPRTAMENGHLTQVQLRQSR